MAVIWLNHYDLCRDSVSSSRTGQKPKLIQIFLHMNEDAGHQLFDSYNLYVLFEMSH